MSFHLIDLMWVGRLGAASTAAVTTSIFVLWAVFSVADIAAVGVVATVARHMGARERDRAAYGAAQGILLALLLALLLAAFGLPSIRPLLRLIGAASDVRHLAASYLTVVVSASGLTCLYFVCESTMRAAGDTRTPLRVVAGSLLLNAALDPLLIFGIGPFPSLGVTGAACATVVAQAAAIGCFAWLAWRRHPAFPLDFGALRRFDPRYALALARIGLPFCLIGALFSVVYLFMTGLAARFGTAAVAVLGIGNRVESIAYLVAVGFAQASEAMVGQNLGAGRPDRAERAAWLSTGLTGAFAFLLSIVMWVWPEGLLRFFTPDADVVRSGVPYLRVLAICQVFTAFELVMNGSFSGAGDTVPPMLISTTISALRIPLAWWLSLGLGLGLVGIAWTITGTCVVRGSLLALWFRHGAWKTKALATVGFSQSLTP